MPEVARLAVRKGTQHLNGRRALIYSRIRVNELNPAETDFDRTRRQQQVVEATLSKATSFSTALHLPFVGEDLVAPLATDLGAASSFSSGGPTSGRTRARLSTAGSEATRPPSAASR